MQDQPRNLSYPTSDGDFGSTGDSTDQDTEEPSPDNPVEEEPTSIERAKRATELATPEEASVSLEFGADDLPYQLAHASDKDLNMAAFGVIRLDADGVIQFYNTFEERLSG